MPAAFDQTTIVVVSRVLAPKANSSAPWSSVSGHVPACSHMLLTLIGAHPKVGGICDSQDCRETGGRTFRTAHPETALAGVAKQSGQSPCTEVQLTTRQGGFFRSADMEVADAGEKGRRASQRWTERIRIKPDIQGKRLNSC